MQQSAGSAHPSFKAIRSENIPSLNLVVEQYEHIKTGAAHYHLASDSSENVFLVALRTVPEDSTGVAHILEHTALCGSERFPVRDPFFMMLRRSLNTFMNAFTSSDWTAYPFASQNRKDFNNLLEVYLDAVFFSRLDPLDFSQEGHRVEFSEADNPESDLVYKGVVFNEMKGAMSSISSTLWNSLCYNLFPSSTYHYNSGGDPERIPDLSYEELLAFYRSHYHPSNAIFMTFGDISAEEHQAKFEEDALHSFEPLEEKIQVLPETRFGEPKRVVDSYAFDDSDGTENKTHIVIGWMLGESANLEQLLEAQLLSSVLMDNSASPLQQLLETTDLGRAPSPLCGLEDSMREMVFCCGIEGTEADHADALEQSVLEVIEQVANEGVPLERIEAVLHQLELHQREISGDSYPYGLQLILQALGSATHYSDPIAVLNLDPVIESLRERIKDPDYIKRLARTLLLENQHRITLVMTPDTGLSETRREAEAARLADIKGDMDEEQRAATVKLAADLVARQAQLDDESILPKVGLEDVAPEIPELTFSSDSAGAAALTSYSRGTNGIVYQQLVYPLPELEPDQLQILPLYTSMLTELGIGERSYLEIQEEQAAAVGSMHAFATSRASVDDEQDVSAYFSLSTKALEAKVQDQSSLMREVIESARFDEADRMRDLARQMLARREQSITGNGHSLAMTAACAGMSPLANISHQQSGLAGIEKLRALTAELDDQAGMDAFAGRLQDIHKLLTSQPMQILAVTDEQHLAGVKETIGKVWQEYATAQSAEQFTLPPLRAQRRELWLTQTQVNFCARAYPTVPSGHDDAPALTVLGGFLRNGFLHRAIREQGGAYGGGASQDSNIAAFRFYSYRDPRLQETLEDFDAAIAWMLDSTHEPRALEEAILGVIGSLDKPSSPAGEAKQHFHNRLYGRTHEQREAFRQKILQVSLDDLLRVTRTYLKESAASTAVIAPARSAEEGAQLAAELSLELKEL
jgi:presequence protease